ncbi:MAG: hypothetical protein IKU46_09930 [Peptococcaceae bacterium]|nr:hypothetical protein [Peptococcaceae bacterium]
MEWLMIIAFIVVSIMDSKKKSDQAKQQREQRQHMQGQQAYRGENGPIPERETKPLAKPKAAPKKQSASQGGLFDSLNDWMESLEELLGPDEESMQLPGTQKKAAAKPKRKKTVPQQAKKSPGTLPTKTLMEQRPDREQREAHTKVAASVKPVTASVKPLKNAFENDEQCEHRIVLNPNIQYSKQKQSQDVKAAVIVKTDKDSLVQGIIWSEILGKPKAYQPNEPKFRRRA